MRWSSKPQISRSDLEPMLADARRAERREIVAREADRRVDMAEAAEQRMVERRPAPGARASCGSALDHVLAILHDAAGKAGRLQRRPSTAWSSRARAQAAGSPPAMRAQLRPSSAASRRLIATQRSSPAQRARPASARRGSALPVRRGPLAALRRAQGIAHLLDADLVHRGVDMAAAPGRPAVLQRRRDAGRHDEGHDHVAIGHRAGDDRIAGRPSRSGRCGRTARRRCRPRPIPGPAARSVRRRCPRPSRCRDCARTSAS